MEFSLVFLGLMKPQAKKSNGVKSGEHGAQCFSILKSVIEVLMHLKMIRSFLKFKVQNSPYSCPWYAKLVT
jgi:hypothetical protein